jgi:proline racemase
MQVPLRRISVVDSHTGGEPTRVVIAGGPDLGRAALAVQAENLRKHHPGFLRSVVNEPRGSDVLVGALLREPCESGCVAGVLFFNNVGLLGMCGHGLIGVVKTLAHLGRLDPGTHRIETAVGIVSATLEADGSVSVANVPSQRIARGISLHVTGWGRFTADVAWGGNWFVLVGDHAEEISLGNVPRLSALALALREAIHAAGHPAVDHVELFGPPRCGGNSRNFVLCPGGAYDRSPCGTGTSAKLACLAADGALQPGERWVQESVVGSIFTARYSWLDESAGVIAPVINGTAYLCGQGTLFIEKNDPFAEGITARG